MCTSVLYKNGSYSYFGRNLDLQYAMGNQVMVTPRNLPLKFRNGMEFKEHPAMVGMALSPDGEYPLYFEAMNEYGVGIAGLNFPKLAVYKKEIEEGKSIGLASFELIPYLLCTCKSVADLKKELAKITVLDTSFSAQYQASPLHWLMADKDSSIVVEPLEEGLVVHDDTLNCLTNVPEYPAQYYNFCKYQNLTGKYPVNRITPDVDLDIYCSGLGSSGLPGGVDSMSRFVRVGFTLNNSVAKETDEDTLTQFFHIMQSVAMARGTNEEPGNLWEVTHYTSGCNLATQDFYWTTYGNQQINGLHVQDLNLDGDKLIIYPVSEEQAVNFLN
ncbi:choloylglycine hydrolase [uncultured Faecalibaculum sp.]|uniref:choloylglycine hydrolase n=1 Tax=uncultured Faecalibaculum sp. TaxID=1729681 RepID=UPI0026039D66|nr:choloylglycine hydrolase [uncultured Faecalibaculum sp.]